MFMERKRNEFGFLVMGWLRLLIGCGGVRDMRKGWAGDSITQGIDTASDNWPPVGWSRNIVYIAICPMINQKGRIFCRTCRGRMALPVACAARYNILI